MIGKINPIISKNGRISGLREFLLRKIPVLTMMNENRVADAGSFSLELQGR